MTEYFNGLELMTFWEWGLAMAAGLAVLLLFRGVAELFRRIDPAERRLNQVAGDNGKDRLDPVRPDARRLLTGLAHRFGRQKSGPTGEGKSWEKSKLKSDLLRAGFRSKEALIIFSLIRWLAAVGFGAAALMAGLITRQPPPMMGLMTIGGLGLGFFAPNYFLQKSALGRARKILRELPNVLDLLVIAVEAGLGMDAAFRRVSAELTVSCPLLAEEMTLLTLELQLGAGREEGLRNMARRCGADEIGSLAAMLIQADRFGVSVGRSLRVYSDEVRTKRRQQMEEKAAKIPLKLLFPVLFLIFPAIMAVMAGPALVGIMESMF